jgi:competence protein ComEC
MLPLLACIGGISFTRWLGFEPSWALAAALASLLLYLGARWSKAPWARLAAGNAVMFWLAVASAAYQGQPVPPPLDASPHEVVALAGCVDSLPQREADRLFFLFAPVSQARVRVSVYLKPGESAPPFAYGQRWKLPLRLRAIRNYRNEGSFDAETYFAQRKIFWNGSLAREYEVAPLPGACGSVLQSWLYQVRSGLLNRLATLAAGDLYLQAMLGALLLGDNAKLEDAWTENYRKTGTYHAIVISGLHVSVLASTCFFLLRLTGMRDIYAMMACAALAVFYALLCDLSAPVVRAAGAYILFLLAHVFYRRGRILNLLYAVALLYLLVDPQQLFEPSFQLSFLSVFTLGALAIPLLEETTSLWNQALRNLPERGIDCHLPPRAGERRLELRLLVATFAPVLRLKPAYCERMIEGIGLGITFSLDLILTSAVVLLGLCLPSVLYFHRLTFSSLTANLPVVVLLTLAVPIGFAALAFGAWLMPLLKLLLNTSRDVVDWHLTWDLGGRLPDPPLWLVLSLPLCLLVTAFFARRRSAWTFAPLAAALALFATLLWHPSPPDLAAGRFEITSIDVGQGDGFFLATPSGHLALLDAGGLRSAKFDTGENIVSPYLWSRRITHLHTLIASHGDFDHMAGLLSAHDNFHPAEIWISCQVSGPLWERFKMKATAASTQLRYLGRGDHLKLGELDVDVLWPPREEAIEKSNLTSLVLLVHHGTKRFLLTGDIDASVEARLLEDPQLAAIDFLKVPHHGSKYSSSPAFLQTLRPAIALASAGYENSFHHPHPSVLSRLADAHALLLRTDLMGRISVFSDGKHLSVDSEPSHRQATAPLLPRFEAVQ